MTIQSRYRIDPSIPFIAADAITWTDNTYEEGQTPGGRITGTINIGKTYHHITGIQVTDDPKGFQVAFDPAHQVELDNLHEATGSEGRLEVVTIDGKEYGLFMSPYCD
jgi:hypothetical protein